MDICLATSSHSYIKQSVYKRQFDLYWDLKVRAADFPHLLWGLFHTGTKSPVVSKIFGNKFSLLFVFATRRARNLLLFRKASSLQIGRGEADP